MVKLQEFNMNEFVYVKLTEVGHRELFRQHDEICKVLRWEREYTPPIEDEEGYSKWQLWDLMSKLGHLCRIGAKQPFSTTIKFSIND